MSHCSVEEGRKNTLMDKNLSIVVVEPDQDRGREIAEGLSAIGYRDILVIGDTA